MLIKQGDQRTIRIDTLLAVILASTAGALNSAGFNAYGVFSANMTGNASALSDHVVLGEFKQAGFFGLMILIFIAGAACAGIFIQFGRQHKLRAIYALCIGGEALVLLLLALAGFLISGFDATPIMILVLAFLMGFQNATTTKVSNYRVRSTHVSGIATDLGLELSAFFDRPSRSYLANPLILHGSTLLAFIIGGVIGVFFYRLGHAWLFCAIAILLFAVAFWEIRRAAKE